jgi:DivIVA domain-containing protein
MLHVVIWHDVCRHVSRDTEGRAVGGPAVRLTSGDLVTLTPNHVRNARFSKPAAGALGYDEQDVDALLGRVEATLAGKDTLTADDVRAARFAAPKQRDGGYSAEAVDAFLVEVRLTLARRGVDRRDR